MSDAPKVDPVIEADAVAEWVFKNYIKARPLDAVSFCDVRDKLRELVLSQPAPQQPRDAAAVRAEALEEAAKVADAYADHQDKTVRASIIARAIRAFAARTGGDASRPADREEARDG